MRAARSLILLDMEPLLEAERRRCEQAFHKTEELRARLDRFRQVCEPAYARWFHSRFARLVTRVRELEERDHELEQLVDHVTQEAFVTRCSKLRAYERIMRFREFVRDLQEGGAPEEEFDFGAEDPEDVPREEDPPPAGEEAPRQRRREREPRERTEAPQRTGADARRKLLYRTLARKLHPDVNPRLTSRETALWHEVQAAYDSADLDALETLSALVDSGEQGFGVVRSVSRLRAIWLDFEIRRRTMERQLRSFKKHASWDFDRIERDPKRLSKLSQKIERGLKETALELEGRIAHFAAQVDKWARASRKTRLSRRPVMNKEDMDALTGFGR